ncbi:MAG: hypothetical protein M1826_001513 [Phylliscum demangeonii]|nr:MAG: hypothetical protein M1826_001513 [Phylliscum demangeonii]
MGPEADSETDLYVDESLVVVPVQKLPGTTNVDLDGLLHPPLKLSEDLKSGCGGMIWPAGSVLAKYLIRRHGSGLETKEMSVLLNWALAVESAGTPCACTQVVGATATEQSVFAFRLAVARGCKLRKRLYITDQEALLDLLQQNIKLNELEDRVCPAVLDWGVPPGNGIPDSPDIVLAADCVYFEPAFPLLLETLSALAGPQTTVYFCYKKRRRADLRFMKRARKIFVVEEVVDDPDQEVYCRENIFLYVDDVGSAFDLD